MALIVFLVLIPILAFGGYRLSRNLRGIDLKSVAGALIAVVIVARFLIYTALAMPVFLILNLVLRTEGTPNNAWISSPFKIQLTNPDYSLSSVNADYFTAIKVSPLTGDVNFANPDWVYALMTVVAVVGLIALTHFILINAQAVLKSLHDKTPFTADNSGKLKQIALLGVSFWALKTAFTVVSTIYLQSQFTTDGLELTLININFIAPLFICGLVLVLAEVFRIGFELKQENELTV